MVRTETAATVRVRVRRALLLVGHGSSFDPHAAAPVRATAKRLRARYGLNVHCAFWKQEPHVSHVLRSIEAGAISVVPMFLADGWFASHVVPAAMGLQPGVNIVDGRSVNYCAPLGVHPRIPDLIVMRALQAAGPRATLATRVRRARAASLVIVGHGTERSRTSGATTLDAAARVERMRLFRDVHVAFLDQHPRIRDVLDRIDAPHSIIVPFLLSAGWHTTHTIPEDAGLCGRRTVRAGRVLWYARPVGTLPAVARIVLDVVGAHLAHARERVSACLIKQCSSRRVQHDAPLLSSGGSWPQP